MPADLSGVAVPDPLAGSPVQQEARADGEDRAGTDFESLWQQAPSAHLLLDDDGTITAVNDTFVQWTGHHRQTVLGTSFTRLLPIGDRILYATHCAPQLMVTGRVSEASVQVLGADGTRHPALLSAARIRPAAHGDDPDVVSGGGRVETTTDHDAGGSTDRPRQQAQVSVVLVDAQQRRRYEEQLLTQRREADDARARIAAAEARLQTLVHRDLLTGLLNRAGLMQALTAALTHPDAAPGERSQHAGDHPRADAGDHGSSTTVVFIDLDGFKTVNDNLGHDAGDELLRVIAERITASWRAGGVVARLAGDEFVLVDDLAGDHVPLAAERLQAALSRPVVLHGVEVVVSASIGVASNATGLRGSSTGTAGSGIDVADASPPSSGADPEPGADGGEPSDRLSPAVRAELLLRRADVAMYRAKAGGAGRVAVHRAGDADPTADRLVLLEQLRTALREDQLRVHYQPRMHLATGTIRGVEALVRGEHPQRGLLGPVHFIDAAEQSGLIRDLGSWVLQRAVQQVADAARVTHAPQAGVPGDLQLSVNVSARQLADPELPMRVASILARAGLQASRLVLEITETALMSQPETALATLRRLKEVGVLLAVDDFGTGYSSFTYLKQFPMDELKIDRSFVAGSVTGSGDAAIVASCVHLAHAMGMVAVAEGVETVEQQEVLRTLDCDQAQGYLFSRPVPWHHIRWSRHEG